MSLRQASIGSLRLSRERALAASRALIAEARDSPSNVRPVSVEKGGFKPLCLTSSATTANSATKQQEERGKEQGQEQEGARQGLSSFRSATVAEDREDWGQSPHKWKFGQSIRDNLVRLFYPLKTGPLKL